MCQIRFCIPNNSLFRFALPHVSPRLTPSFDRLPSKPPGHRHLCALSPSLLSCPETGIHDWRNFVTASRSHKSCEVKPNHRLESVANVQTRISLARPPQFSDRADQKSRRRRDGIRNTRGVASRNEIDFTLRECVPVYTHCETRRAVRQNHKVLNLRRDSKRWTTVTCATLAEKKFINCLSLIRARWRFESAVRRYADK